VSAVPATADVGTTAAGLSPRQLFWMRFKQDKAAPEAVAAARDLAEGSKTLDTRLTGGSKVGFDNDAPRQ